MRIKIFSLLRSFRINHLCEKVGKYFFHFFREIVEMCIFLRLSRSFFLVLFVVNCPVNLKISKSNERASAGASDHGILKSLLANYGDPKTAPTPGPVQVRVELATHYSPVLINRYGWPVLEMTNLWILQHWSDQRLNFRDLSGDRDIKNVSLPFEEMSKIWTPGLVTVNDLELKIRTSHKENIFVVVSEDGQVLVSTRVSVLAPCQTNCANEIRCKLILESGSENIEKYELTV
uniref:Neurotransmitter-gated ion-channel ligand-binding domain-containing protein n=1 Tax=Romanomermis culicivorax TaxID=13658 RepID=A0A915IIG9_ROMCU